MKSGTLKNGFHYEFDETVADDMRFVDLLVDAMDETASAPKQLRTLAKVIDTLLGTEQRNRLYDHIAEQNNGRVPVGVFRDCFTEIMLGEDNSLKN